ncbi:VOC family protein [Streptomyces sp. NPDC048142]|uniref:VOC family protein n=1 Tax=Streptomyces sp. NPDC048142 TaxID=3365501 RepID=UPI003721C1A1
MDDADATADRVRERGATIAVGPLALGQGRAVLAADRDGATFGFWEGNAPAWSVGHDSAPARLDLHTRDVFESATFYSEVFGWARPPGGCTLDYAETSIVVQASGHNVATLRATVPDPQDQARWITDFHVQDTGRAVEAAIAAGGQPSPLLPECGTGTGTTCGIRDPGGALFTVSHP